MVKYVKGNLVKMALEGEFDIIMHGCNCFNTMGAGIAKTIREVFPVAYVADCQTRSGDIDKLGTYTEAEMDCGVTVVNLYTQYGFTGEQPAEYSALNQALSIWATTHVHDGERIGLPWIGAGLGGLDINVVKDIVEGIANMYSLDITMVEFDPMA